MNIGTARDRRQATATRMGKDFLKRLDAGVMFDRTQPRKRGKLVKVRVQKEGRAS